MAEFKQDWEALYRQHHHAVIRLSFSILRCPESAQDVTHEAFIRWACKLANRREDLQPHLGLLYRIARTLSIDLSRQVRRHRESARELTVLAGTVFDSESLTIARDDAARAAAALATLPKRTRTAYLMRRFDGADFNAIGKRLGVSSPRAHQLAAAAMAAIARALDDTFPE